MLNLQGNYFPVNDTFYLYLVLFGTSVLTVLTVNPLSPEGNGQFSKSVTINQQTTCDIPFERYFLKYAINHIKRGRGGHRLDCQVPEMEK